MALALCVAHLPPAVSDVLFAPLISLTVGNITRFGLRKLPYGPLQQVARDHRVPLLDSGAIRHIRTGHIAAYPGITRFSETGVVFENGRELAVQTVIMATGYRPALHDFLPAAGRVIDASGAPVVSGRESPLPGLYLCGFRVTATGMLREIGREAQHIAKELGAKLHTPA